MLQDGGARMEELFMKIDDKKIEEIFVRKELRLGIEKYLFLINRLHQVDVSVDREFQKVFNGFFRLRQRSASFYTDYYAFMENKKRTGVTFEETLKYIKQRQGSFEISFSSKLIAIINTEMPVWDSVVTKEHFGIKPPYLQAKNRQQKIIDSYYEYCDKYYTYMKTENAKKMIYQFNQHFPDTEISDVKKIDFILWQDRK